MISSARLDLEPAEVVDRLTWCEVSRSALMDNLAEFRALVGGGCALAPVVKANAYGHGMELCARVFQEGGADALCVNDAWEAESLRRAGIHLPLWILGRVPPEQARDVVKARAGMVLYDPVAARAVSGAAAADGSRVSVLLKLETGTNRQGVAPGDLLELARLVESLPGVDLAGVSTHFADVEDTTDHDFARRQLGTFTSMVERLCEATGRRLLATIGNTAATILWPEAHLDMVRVGIGMYGMWPSTETFVTAALTHRNKLGIRPALAWKTRVAQVKDVPAGSYVGYGRTYRTTHSTRLAILPVGYYEGYDRGVSNLAWVLVKGRRAQVRGRVCMNMTMVDVTDIPGVEPGTEVVLLGSSGEERVSAEQFASWAGTINYEVTTRISETVPRIQVD